MSDATKQEPSQTIEKPTQLSLEEQLLKFRTLVDNVLISKQRLILKTTYDKIHPSYHKNWTLEANDLTFLYIKLSKRLKAARAKASAAEK
ncbi:MAG: hypothetical protein KBD78_01365 [Oligoflexales bacterium]|nr:hypothetical protein [Oligoflexales bacterium]